MTKEWINENNDIREKLNEMYKTYIKLYILNKENNNENEDIKNQLNNIKFNIHKENINLMNLNNKIEKETQIIRKNINNYESNLSNQNDLFNSLTMKNKLLTNKNNASNKMLDDLTTSYNTLYYTNIKYMSGCIYNILYIIKS